MLYRDEAEAQEWRKRDPIQLLSKELVGEGQLSPAELVALDQGAQAAIVDAVQFAEASPFRTPMSSGRTLMASADRLLTYSGSLNEALRQEMQRDPRVIVMARTSRSGGWWRGFGVTKGLVDEFGSERVRDTPISEEGIVAMGVGAAMAGLRPVVELMYFDFVTLAMEPLVNQAAKVQYMFGRTGACASRCQIECRRIWWQGRAALAVTRVVARSYTGHQSPRCHQHPSDARGLLQTAIRDDGPVVFLEHKLLYFLRGHVPEDAEPIEFGRATVRRHGETT
jgi:pyruvate/2-oxoglutarate/acetoin dehydrogenase E1 component